MPTTPGPTQWWQRGTQTPPTTSRNTITGTSTHKGTRGTGKDRRPAYGGTYNPTATNPALEVNQWWMHEPAYGGTYNPTALNPAFPVQTTRPPAYGGTHNPTARNNPAFPERSPLQRGTPAYGGTYNPTALNPAFGGGPTLAETLGLGEGVNPFVNAGPSLNQLLGLPEGVNPFVTQTGGGTLGARVPLTEAAAGTGGGFATTYGGNWRRRRGGGGYGGYGSGYGGREYTPAWLLGLQSWNFNE